MPEKLVYVTEEQLREASDPKRAQQMAEKLIEAEQPKVGQKKDIEDFEPKEWFTNTSNSEYLD
jgi:hypothetical protein